MASSTLRTWPAASWPGCRMGGRKVGPQPRLSTGCRRVRRGMGPATASLLTREAGEWEAHEFIAAVQAAIDGLEPGPQPERRDPSVTTTLHGRIGLIPDLLARGPDDVFARFYNGRARGLALSGMGQALFPTGPLTVRT